MLHAVDHTQFGFQAISHVKHNLYYSFVWLADMKPQDNFRQFAQSPRNVFAYFNKYMSLQIFKNLPVGPLNLAISTWLIHWIITNINTILLIIKIEEVPLNSVPKAVMMWLGFLRWCMIYHRWTWISSSSSSSRKQHNDHNLINPGQVGTGTKGSH